MYGSGQVPRSMQKGPRHLSGVVLARIANFTSASFPDLPELSIDTADKVCNHTLRHPMPDHPLADPCTPLPQLIENLATASKVVELVDACACCLLQDRLDIYAFDPDA